MVLGLMSPVNMKCKNLRACVCVCILVRRQFGDDVTTRHLAEKQTDVEDGVKPADLRAVPVEVSQLHACHHTVTTACSHGRTTRQNRNNSPK